MTEVLVLLDSQEKISTFVRACEMHKGEVTAYSGRYVVNGKSIMGLHSLDLGKPIKIEFEGSIDKKVREIFAPLVVQA